MYRHCIFCSADLGANDALEAFPVGRSVAFDGAKGRLWAVCGRCARWNLAPLEERWEASEAAERIFRDTRLRVQSENVGLARLRDGTRLIRIGAALPKEFAGWRWGGMMAARHRRYLRGTGVRNVAGLAAGGAAALGLATFYFSPFGWVLGAVLAGGAGRTIAEKAEELVERVQRMRRDYRVVYRLPRGVAPGGAPLTLRRGHLRGAYLVGGAAPDALVLHVPAALPDHNRPPPEGKLAEPVRLEGAAARAVLARALVDINSPGLSARVSGRVLGLALQEIARAPSPAEYVAALARRGATLELPLRSDEPGASTPPPLYWSRRAREEALEARQVAELQRSVPVFGTQPSLSLESLALEMALHEEQERRALEGELAVLESAWREAEEIAAIADRLPDDPLEGFVKAFRGSRKSGG